MLPRDDGLDPLENQVDPLLNEIMAASARVDWDLRPEDVVTRARSRQSRTVMRSRLGVALVAAAIIAVFVVPFPQLHLFGSSRTNTAAGHHPPPTLPAVDLSATSQGWIPVAYGDAQISVPESLAVYYPGQDPCERYSAPGALFVPPTPTSDACPGLEHPHATVVRLLPAREVPQPYANEKPMILNGVPIYPADFFGPRPWNSFQNAIFYAPSLGVEITVDGPLGRRVVDTLTRSPRTVALASGLGTVVPSGWRTVTFRGMAFAAPRSWPVTRTSLNYGIGQDCATEGVALYGSRVILSTDRHFLTFNCGFYESLSPQTPRDAAQVDAGLSSPPIAGESFSTHCLDLHGLTACPATSPVYSVLVLRVTVPGRVKPVFVSIGLAGNGMVARTILDSLRVAPSQALLARSLCRASLGTRALNWLLATVADVRQTVVGAAPINRRSQFADAFPGAKPNQSAAWCWTGSTGSYTLFAVVAERQPLRVEGLDGAIFSKTPGPGPAPIP